MPAVTKRGDRQHESDLEQERADLASAAWVREHRASAYERLVKAMDEHEALDDDPQHTRYRQRLDFLSRMGTLPSPEHAEEQMKAQLTMEELLGWKHRREVVLTSVSSDLRMWASYNMQRAWEDLKRAAWQHDMTFVSAAYEKEEQGESPVLSHSKKESSFTPPSSDLPVARDRIKRQVAFDLQGPHLYYETPDAQPHMSDPQATTGIGLAYPITDESQLVVTYALQACSRALLRASKPALASCTHVGAGDDRWLMMAVRGHLGGHVSVMRGPGSSMERCRHTTVRFRAGISPSGGSLVEAFAATGVVTDQVVIVYLTATGCRLVWQRSSGCHPSAGLRSASSRKNGDATHSYSPSFEVCSTGRDRA